QQLGHTITTNLPSNSLVDADSAFVKSWNIKNHTEQHWKGLTLRCIDEDLDVQIINAANKTKLPTHTLQPEHWEIRVPDTNVGYVASVSVNFMAPKHPGTTVSHWRFFKNGKRLNDDLFPALNCLVMVVDSTPCTEQSEVSANCN
ncbi:MAG: hypothetical protein CSB47_00585, partial [Proteobacteria bacterium]